MAKFEIIKETEFTGRILYYIEKDGIYVNNSASRDLTTVEDFLHRIMANNEQLISKEILKTIETDED
mgnify:CR=1 FL=1